MKRPMFVATKHVFCRDKSMLAATTVLWRQIDVCPDKIFLSRQTRVYRDKHTFVAAKDVFCGDKHLFLATKMILVEAPVSDR